MMTEKRHLCGNCRECLQAERDILKQENERLEFLYKLNHSLASQWEERNEKLYKHLEAIDKLIEKRKMLSHESFYSIDLRKLIELREGQNESNIC